MGFFDTFLKRSRSQPYTQQEAMFGILLTSVIGDRSIEDLLSFCRSGSKEKEWNTIFTIAGYMRLFGGTKKLEKSWKRMQNKLNRQYISEGCESLVLSCAASLENELRETAFAAACDVIFRDGSVDNQEKRMMNMLQRHLAIDPNLAKKTIRVMSIKNRA